MSFTLTTLNTPFGLAMFAACPTSSGPLAVLLDESNPHAAIYAAKMHGVSRIVEVVSATAADPLLEPGDILIPDELVDLTAERSSTFFVNRGYGFIGQQPVWCPQTRAMLIAAGQTMTPRLFTRGTLAVAGPGSDEAAARAWSAHAVASTGAPATYLAKELELCYAVVAIIGQAADAQGNALIAALKQHLPEQRTCACNATMQSARDRGLVGDDWRLWIGDIHGNHASE